MDMLADVVDVLIAFDVVEVTTSNLHVICIFEECHGPSGGG